MWKIIFRYSIVMENTEKKGNAWTNFVKDWAAKRNITYMEAIKNEEVKSAYKEGKKQKKKLVIVDNFTKLKDDAVAMAEAIDPAEPKKKAGRPSKYENEDERKEAKRLKTLASNKKKREEMSKKRKDGTMTAVEKEIWEHDTELNVIRTTKFREKGRGTAIQKHEEAINKLSNYIEDNKAEYLRNFVKDPYEQRGWNSEGWKPKTKYQKRAVELFGKISNLTAKAIAEIALSPDEYAALYNTYIPDYASIYEDSSRVLNPKVAAIQSKVDEAINKQARVKRINRRMMGEEDPLEKKWKEEKKAAEKEETRLEKIKEDKEERERQKALTPAERKAEMKAQRDFLANLGIYGSGRGGGREWISVGNKSGWG